MSKLFSSIACNLDSNILQASLPLFEAEKVEAIEWSFDTLYNHKNIPPWFVELLTAFGNEGRLIGHGVYFSLFSGKWSKSQENWLDHLKKVTKNFHFDHITEHFGFMTGENFHKGAPIGVPMTPTTMAIGQDRLKRICEVCKCPVGLENLAFAYSLDEVKRHGDFLNQLISPINGFIILDLHNLYCQIHNFEVSYDEIIQLYPLEKVREIHISGGSWEESDLMPNKKIRRDTHDDSVPKEVFELLEKTIEKCTNLKFVVLEQIGNGLETVTTKMQFQNDFLKMNEIVQKNQYKSYYNQNEFLPKNDFKLEVPMEDQSLHDQQMELSGLLENAVSYIEVQEKLLSSSLANTAWEIEKWNPAMVETVYKIAQKWKNGFIANSKN